MTNVDELLESMRTTMAQRPVPPFEAVVRRRQRTARRHFAIGSATVLLAGAAGAGAYLAVPSTSAGPGVTRVSASSTGGASLPVPELADGDCSTVQLSQSSPARGQSDPIAAAEQFARQSGSGYPLTGWHVVHQESSVAQVESGGSAALVTRGADGSWQVVSAQRCD